MTNSGNEPRDRKSSAGLDLRDQELIAAFIDQRLSPEERAAFMRRLDEDEALYEVFAETVRFHDQEAGRPATVIAYPWGRARWWVPAAVAAVLVVALAAALLLRGLAGQRYAESLMASGRLAPPPGGAWYEPSWAVTRGISAALPEADAAFRAGARAIDLEVALRLGLDEDAIVLVRQLEVTVGEIDFSQALQASYDQLGEQLEADARGAGPLELAERASDQFVEQLPDLEPPYRLGRWAEAGRLAARSGNRQLLASRAFARDLRALARDEWDPPVAAALETAAGLLRAPEEGLDLDSLEAAFVAILEAG